jgi:hypothetical protein
MSGRGSKWKEASQRAAGHGTLRRDAGEHRCAVCGAKVDWPSRLDLGRGIEPIALCSKHQGMFGLDYPPND